MIRLFQWPLVACLILALAACGDDADNGPASDTDGSDAAEDAAGDTSGDTTPDDTADTDDGSGDTEDAAGDAEPDADIGEEEDTWVDISEEPFDLSAPWNAPTAEWDRCDDGERTVKTLAEKAAYYDWIVRALHTLPPDTPNHEEFTRVFPITCDGPVPTEIVDAAELPTCTFDHNENSGLWTGLYITSQAYRYAATGSAEALENVRRTLAAAREASRITSVPGLYARDVYDPRVPQMRCPSSPRSYIPPDANMVGNSWVLIDDDGCFKVFDPTVGEDGEWVREEGHCIDASYAGYCWQRNMSKDEMSGQVVGAVTAARLVDDPEVREIARELLGNIGHHLVDHNFWLTEYDGRPTRYGSAYALSFDHYPGYNAFLALAWVRAAASATGDERLLEAYHNCLLQKNGTRTCIERGLERPRDYREYIREEISLRLGCQTNYDNVGIMTLTYLSLMLMEPDAENVALFRQEFQRGSRGPDVGGRNLWEQGNPMLNFVLVAMMDDTLNGEPQVAEQLVRDGVCSLRLFHDDKHRNGVDNSELEVFCESERHGELAEEAPPIAQRCVHMFEWWGDPNEIEFCTENVNRAEPPSDFLLPYWMGRYYGFIGEDT